MADKIAFVAYETPLSPGGGIAAVMGRFPAVMRRVAGRETVVIAPFHHRIGKVAALDAPAIGEVRVGPQARRVRIRLFTDPGGIPWYLLEAEDKAFFAGFPHPYRLADDPAENGRLLLRDSLLFGAAAAETLGLIGHAAQWLVHLLDWEAATAALALDGQRAFLTLHNSYDSGVCDADLLAVGIDPARSRGATILQRAIPLVRKPIFTVSKQFALDLTEDVLQTQLMAGHLQDLLRGQLVGVDNGAFASLLVDEGCLAWAAEGDYGPLASWKLEHRRAALAALDAHCATDEAPIWGDRQRFSRDLSAPWFIMAGRDDSRQKGYDLAAIAVEEFLARGGDARFVFFPIPGDEGLEGLAFLQALAERFPCQVLALPFVWREGFLATLRGATFGLMPSLYEPFGMANEFYLMGAVGVGRATGGIVQQIVPWAGAASFSHAAAWRARRWHPDDAAPTGLLYREPDGIPSAAEDLRRINAADYRLDDPGRSRLAQRRPLALYRAMADATRGAIEDAAGLWRRRPDLCQRMLVAGIEHIRRSFTWERTAEEYLAAANLAQA